MNVDVKLEKNLEDRLVSVLEPSVVFVKLNGVLRLCRFKGLPIGAASPHLKQKPPETQAAVFTN